MFEKFKKQLNRSKEGWYETGLIWRENNIPLENNKCGSLGRLKSLLKNLDQKQEVCEACDSVIKDQLENNIEEFTNTEINNSSTEFYMPDRAVIRASTESTKLRVIYDASVKSGSGFSLNDCLENGLPLQNKLWDILIRTRLRPVVLCGDMEKAFLQIRIRENERDCLRFHWSEKANYDIIKIYRFTRLVFRLNWSPFILEDTLKIHFENYIWMFRELIDRVNDDMFVDDLVTRGESTSEVDKIKDNSVNFFRRGSVKLHKWHSNKQALEINDLVNENELNFAKQHLGTKPKATKILGLLWYKRENTFIIQVPNVNKNATNRNILSTLASIYDPLGFVSRCLWRCGVVLITTAQLHSTKPELRSCAGLKPARGVSKIRAGENL